MLFDLNFDDDSRASQVIDYSRMKFSRFRKFKTKVHLFSERGNFQLKTVSNNDELEEAFRLRWEVFHHEMLGKKRKTGLDIDDFDFDCDHLIIKDTETGLVVGTYRFNCSLFSEGFYSSQEFNISKLLKLDGPYLELGRACIRKDYRTGLVIALLWRGIAEYMMAVDANVLFGCATIKTNDPREAALLYRHFEAKGYFLPEYFCPPTKKYRMSNFDLWASHFARGLTEAETKEAEAMIPTLCKSYLRAGAVLGGEPAFDKEFQCIDFLTVLVRSRVDQTMWKKFSR